MAETKLFVSYSAKITDKNIKEDSTLIDVTMENTSADAIKFQLYDEAIDPGDYNWTNADKRNRIKLLSVQSLGEFTRSE